MCSFEEPLRFVVEGLLRSGTGWLAFWQPTACRKLHDFVESRSDQCVGSINDAFTIAKSHPGGFGFACRDGFVERGGNRFDMQGLGRLWKLHGLRITRKGI